MLVTKKGTLLSIFFYNFYAFSRILVSYAENTQDLCEYLLQYYKKICMLFDSSRSTPNSNKQNTDTILKKCVLSVHVLARKTDLFFSRMVTYNTCPLRVPVLYLLGLLFGTFLWTMITSLRSVIYATNVAIKEPHFVEVLTGSPTPSGYRGLTD
jgi:hypothetical protein